ncbi:protein axin isoform X2 [Lycorma delicatula]|uniref:protein axin isoform X2 n=1 Tax=Lycorma delicatula TaxID=130591 RepID=UPI003F5186F0
MSVPPQFLNSINNSNINNNSNSSTIIINTTVTASTTTSTVSSFSTAATSFTGSSQTVISSVLQTAINKDPVEEEEEECEEGEEEEEEEGEREILEQGSTASAAGCVTPDKALSGGASSPIPMTHHHRHHHYHHQHSSSHHQSTHSGYPEPLGAGTEQMGYEPDSSSTLRDKPPELGCSPPAYLRWARHLHALLQDPDGVALFRSYLESEGRSHADTLEFWFACEGLRKQTDPKHITRLVKAIYRRYFLKTQLKIGEELRKAVNEKIKEASNTGATLDAAVFDRSQKEVERLITETTYPNFLQSDLYLQHVQTVQNGSSSSSGSASGSSSGSSNGSCSGSSGGIAVGSGSITTVSNTVTSSCLATLHEDCELGASDTVAHSTPPLTALPLTRDMLLVTQKRRASELRPKPEAYAGLYLQPHGKSSHGNSWIHHSSYNPVSRQDSELQSLSSDARTESDNMSMTDSSVDGGAGNGGMGGFSSHRYSKKQYQVHCRQVKEAASLNRDPYMHHTVIPRTQRFQKEQIYPMKPDEFAAILIEKLENVKRDQETKESLDRKLLESSDLCSSSVDCVGPTSLADAIREKLQVDIDNDNDQDILDQHVSRVWSDRTPGLASPPPELRRSRPSNPPTNKLSMSGSAVSGHMGMSPFTIPSSHHQHQHHMYQTRPHQRHSHSHSRKERDVFSTFSSDSGNVHDFPEGSEHRLHMTKSKSMPEYGEANVTGHDGRFRQSSREWCGSGSRRWSSKKTELTDSGVSVVSDTPPISVSHTNKDSRVLSWLLESDKQQICDSGQPACGSYSAHSGERDSSSSCSLTKSYPHRVRPGVLQPVLPVSKTARNVAHSHSHSRSGSLERTGSTTTSSGPAPAQPFVADPSMPPLPSPHTPTQLEEARRRLLEDELRSKQPRQRYSSGSGSSSKMMINMMAQSSYMDNPASGISAVQQPIGSTLKRSGNSGSGLTTSRGITSNNSGSGGGGQQLQQQPVVVPPEMCTTVVFSFCDEQFPYRTKIPGQQVTLRQFKEYLPKKGLYRYFFKTECDDVDTKVIQEEIVDDNEILPLWEGKVMAQVKPIE